MATGAETTPFFRLLTPVLLLICITSGGTLQLVNAERTWCVAKPSLDEATLLSNINYACSQVDCGVLQRGCPCFFPDTLISHASIAMNLYYQSRGRNPWNCFFKNSALVVTTDPSFGGCTYA
ncbi:major pollen allergen Ole e 10 [Canna indica]|uniref:Major pollen allergen Ole e 10 n=1 Tax=Canna indica TaxID=4628 RepID=A0AAQ3QAD6_9LILI|nr:major pollen allergen Ole e 10 [Canna indica]